MRELNEQEYGIALAIMKKYLHDRLHFRELNSLMSVESRDESHYDWRYSKLSLSCEELFHSLLGFLGAQLAKDALVGAYIGEQALRIASQKPDIALGERAAIALKKIFDQIKEHNLTNG